MEKQNFEIGSILVGSYLIGYWSRYKYFKVKSLTKSGAPRVIELKKEIVSNTSTPADATLIHELSKDNEEIGEILISRKNKLGNFGVKVEGKYRASLSPYVPGKQYREDSYY